MELLQFFTRLEQELFRLRKRNKPRWKVFYFLTGGSHGALNPMFVKIGTTVLSSPLQAARLSNGGKLKKGE